MLDARDEILVEHHGMAGRNATVVRECRSIVENMQSEAGDQYKQAHAFRDALVRERHRRWGERLLWSALTVILIVN